MDFQFFFILVIVLNHGHEGSMRCIPIANKPLHRNKFNFDSDKVKNYPTELAG